MKKINMEVNSKSSYTEIKKMDQLFNIGLNHGFQKEKVKDNEKEKLKEKKKGGKSGGNFDKISFKGNFTKVYNKHTLDIIGQNSIKNKLKPKIFSSIMSMKLGIKEKPTIFFFAGNSRTGKTMLAEKIGKIVGGDSCYIPMSNYSERHSLGGLLGTTAGLVGYQDKQIIEKYIESNISGRYTLIFDEIEKADKGLESFFLELLDRGEITLLNGKKLNLKNSIIIFTSNLGIQKEKGLNIGFNTGKLKKDNNSIISNILKEIKGYFSTEIFNRLGGEENIYIFKDLNKKDYTKIIDNKIENIFEKIFKKISKKEKVNKEKILNNLKKDIKDINQENLSLLNEKIEQKILLDIYYK